eukprot:scaffold2927_cov268-Chaetoceros_neogracile.AAC.39
MVKGKLQDAVPSSAKVTRFWHNDGPTDSINSLSVLMSWLTTEGNYSRWRGGDKSPLSSLTIVMLRTGLEQLGQVSNAKSV